MKTLKSKTVHDEGDSGDSGTDDATSPRYQVVRLHFIVSPRPPPSLAGSKVSLDLNCIFSG